MKRSWKEVFEKAALQNDINQITKKMKLMKTSTNHKKDN